MIEIKPRFFIHKSISMCLFLLLSFSLSQLSSSLFSDTLVLLVRSSQSQGSESGLLWNLNSSWLRLWSWLDNWESSSSGQDLFSLWSLTGSWEDDQLGLVLLESLHVQLEDLSGSVLTSVVNSNTNGSGVSWGQASSLDLSQGETSTSSNLSVVLDGWGSDNRSEGIQWSWSNGSSLRSSSLTTGSLLTGLVKMNSNTLLPVLSEVVLQKWEVLGDSCVKVLVYMEL